MLLVFDVGNSNIVMGVFKGNELFRSWRVSSDKLRTEDEYAILVRQLFGFHGIAFTDIRDIIVSCVVPPMLNTLVDSCETYFNLKPYVVGRGIKTGMPILYENPREVGADRIVNAVAAYEAYRRNIIVVDFGTATTFDYITGRGEYQGGAIAPGLDISSAALFEAASKLPRVELARPPAIIARNTVNSIQAGLFYGYAGLVDGIVVRMKEEVDQPPVVVATGGLCEVISPASRTIDAIDPFLTLKGLRIIYQRNKTTNVD